MKTAGIVAEYNPFHNGHKYQIDVLRQKGFTHIVSAMSGNFVQRGDIAVADKWTRTSMAIKNGVDLLLEIPTDFCLAPAEKYCGCAVEILNNSGIVNSIAFGSETGDIDLLLKTANEVLNSTDVNNKIKENLKTGITYAAARESAVKSVYGESFSSVLKNPNDVLAIEYIRSLSRLKSDITPIAIKRCGTGHNDTETTKTFASASRIREMMKNGEDYSPFIPKSVFDELSIAKKEQSAPVFLENGERAFLARLRELSDNDFEKLQDVSEGFHNRLYNVSVKKADSIETLYTLAKTKRYTLARIRRLFLNAALGIFEYKMPPYIKVLGFSENGRELLKKLKENSKIPVVTSYSDAKITSEEAKIYFEIQAKYTDFYSMFMPKVGEKGIEYSKSIVKI